MKILLKGWVKGALILSLSISFVSCEKSFDLKPEDALDYSQAYQNVYDADAVVFGIYGKMAGIADRYLVLNELRADLEDVTQNSDQYLKQLNNHDVSLENPWADPKPFYEIILNCNDVLKNFDIMLENKRLTQADYDIRKSEVITARAWLYLQLGIHYGNVPYITDPLATFADLKDESKYPKIPFTELLDKLIISTESMPNKDPLPSTVSLSATLDSYPTLKMFINKYFLMGDLYLWKGDYPSAAKYYHKLMTYAEVLYPGNPADEKAFNTYSLGTSSNSGTTYIGNDRWTNIFTTGFTDRYANEENITMLPFDKKFDPVNPFIDLYYNKYVIKPSALAINKWNAQNRSDNTPFDTWRGLNRSYFVEGNQTYINKQISNYSKNLPFETTDKWIIYRAALLHLHMAEAANRDGRDRLAYALLNNGIRSAYTPVPSPSNVINVMQSNVYMNSANEWVADPNKDYYFDARFGTAPNYRAYWHTNAGVRGRMSLAPVKVDSAQYFNMTVPGKQYKEVNDRPGLILAMEDLILEEVALEGAFEGYRWQDLLRIALRRKDIQPSFLADKIAAKFEAKGDAAGAAAVRAKLATEAGWYLPFKM